VGFVLVAILAAAAALRFINLGVPSFWVDELNHVFAGKSIMSGETPRFPSGVPNVRAWIYSTFVAGSFKIFGVNEFAARVPSAVFGVLGVLVIFFAARGLFNNRVGLLAAFLLTFSHIAIGWSRTCRMYTLFQFLYLLAAYAFYRGFDFSREVVTKPGKKPVSFIRLNAYFKEQGIKLGWLIVSAILFLVLYKVHQLTGIFAAALLIYIATMFVVRWIDEGVRPAFISKYALLLGLALFMTIVGIFAFRLTEFVKFAIGFQPGWAKYTLVTDSHYYYWFLTESSQFPIAALFIIGAVQMAARLDKPAFFVFCNFAIPVLLHSYVFAYKIPNYIFNVYPFFLLLAGYALDNIFQTESEQVQDKLLKSAKFYSKRLINLGTWLLVLGWLPLTVWFRYALKLPFMGPTGSNGAVEHFDWRGAANYVRAHGQESDVVITSLPLTMLYYLGRVDYNLNEANLDESLEWHTYHAANRQADFYSGAPAVRTLDDLKQVIAAHASGWIVVDTYRLQRSQYIPPAIASYMSKALQLAWSDPMQTIKVFHWSDETRY
jgi:4-amino-4-deoxy-L-arabinose transferase-like glycosyltransferase